jgi:hypothetical protein
MTLVCRFLSVPAVVIIAGLLTAGAAYAKPPALVVSEIMFNPDGNENAREYVEILNLTGSPVSLEGCRIRDNDATDALTPVTKGSWMVPADSYALILDPDYFASGEPYAGIPASAALFTVTDSAIGMRGLSNSTPETVTLLSAGGDTLSAVRYSIDCPPGHSWERILPNGGDSAENFKPSLKSDGTPGARNSVTPPDVNPGLGSDAVRFGPSGPEMGNPVELRVTCRNMGLAPLTRVAVSLTMLPDIDLGIVVFDEVIPPGGVSAERVLTGGPLPGGYLTVRAAIVSDVGTGYAADDTAYAFLDVPVPDGALVLNEIMAAPADGPEWIEIANTTTQPVSPFGWRIGDFGGAHSQAVDHRCFIPPGGYAVVSGKPGAPSHPGAVTVVVPNFPALNNDRETVYLLDRAGAFRDSVAYTDAATGTSFELISPSLRFAPHAWGRSVDPSGSTPGARNSILFAPPENGASAEAALTISPNPFEDATTISCSLPFPLSRIRVEVYDRRGRNIAVLRGDSDSGSSWSMTWDGRSGGSRLPSGAYILSFEALDTLTGAVVTIRKPIVIARPF